MIDIQFNIQNRKENIQRLQQENHMLRERLKKFDVKWQLHPNQDLFPPGIMTEEQRLLQLAKEYTKCSGSDYHEVWLEALKTGKDLYEDYMKKTLEFHHQTDMEVRWKVEAAIERNTKVISMYEEILRQEICLAGNI